MNERLTDAARQAMQAADRLSREAGDDQICVEHILHGLLEDDSNRGVRVLMELNVDLERVVREIGPPVPDPPPTTQFGRLRRHSFGGQNRAFIARRGCGN